MADFAVAAPARSDRYDTAATAVTAVTAAVRAQIAKKLANGVPARARTLFRASWWDQAVDQYASPAFAGIAVDTIDDFADGLDLNLDFDQRADVGGRTVGAVLGLLAARFDTVRARVRDLHAQALADDWDPDQLADALGLDGDSPGVLSDAMADTVGRSLATMLIEAAGVYILGRSDRSATKTWRAVGDDRTRPAHAEADGQTVDIDETFDVGGEDAMFPGDPQLSADNAVGCRCSLEYSVAAAEITTDIEDEEDAMAASAGLAQPAPDALAAATAAFAVDGARVTVTVEPTAAEKQLLAAVADVPAQLHIPLLDVGDVASFTPDARTALAGALATVASVTPPLSGTIAGTGYLETAGVTVGIVDCPGLGALRDQIADTLLDLAPEPGEFIPAVVLTAGSIDATQIAGVPVHFNELRVHVGAVETLVFDLLGPLPTAPPLDTTPPPDTVPPPADTPPPPEAPAMPTTTASTNTGSWRPATTGTRVATGTSTTFAPGDPVADPGVTPAVEQPPTANLVDVPDADIEAEIARRAAQAAATTSGGAVEDYMDEAAEETAGAIAEIAAELQMEATEPEEPAETPVSPAASYRSKRAARFADVPPTVPSPDLVGLADADLEAEVARRAATVAAAATGVAPENLMADATEEATGMIAEITAEILAGPDEETTEPAVPPVMPAAVAADVFADGDLAPDINGDGLGEPPLPVDYDWEGILAIEDTLTSDGRMFAPGALTWRTLPLTLSLQTVTAPGHDGGVICGSICEIERVGNNIIGRGKFSGTDAGDLARTLIGEGSLHGVSIDVASAVVVYTNDAGDDVEEIDVMFGEPATAVFVEAEMMGAHLTPFPAFADARVDLLDGAQQPTSLVAAGAPGMWRLTGPAFFTLLDGKPATDALVASAAPAIPAPPAHLFALKPDTHQPFSVGTPLPDGTIPVYGLLADWKIPHIGYGGRKVYPPRGDDFATFYTGKHVVTREGDRIPTGPIFIDTVHPNLAAQASDAQAFYAHTGAAVADVHLYNAEHGIVAAGVLRPGVDELAVRRFQGSDVSPDWRPINGQYRMVAILAVNASGFPVPYVEGIAASAGQFRSWVAYDDATGEPLAMVAVGAPVRERRPSDAIVTLQAQVEDSARRLAVVEAQLAALTAPASAAVEDDGPVELSADERAARARAAMAILGIDRGSRARRARATLGLLEPAR